MTNFQDIFGKSISEDKFKEANPIVLAFVGDAVHALYVKDQIIKSQDLLVKDYHKKSSLKCRASYQAEYLDKIMEHLKEDEKAVVRRARNAKTKNIAKNSDIETYKKATSFEALVGYLYLQGNFDRLNEILKGQE